MKTGFFEFNETHIADILGYVGDLVGDLMPLIVLILGITIGLWVIQIIVNLKN